MGYSLILSLLIVIISLIILTRCQLSNDMTTSWMEERLFDRARCKANCLRLFNNPEEQRVFHSKWNNEIFNDLIWSTCFENSREQCSSGCFTACDLPPNECSTHCTAQATGCHIGCILIKQTLDNPPGLCPKSFEHLTPNNNQSSSFEQTNQKYHNGHNYPTVNQCVSNCQMDNDCKDPLQICCRSDCHQYCTIPVYNELVPPRPTHLNSTVSSTNVNIMKLFWSSQYQNVTNTNNPIVFILQIRICTCKMFDESYATKWQTLIMTHEFGVNLEAFEPGRLYQFRIAAVSIHGTRGFGLGTNAYPVDPIKPSPPGPPRNVIDSLWRLYSSGKISLLLRWQPPLRSDLPLIEYLIIWSIDHGYLQTDGQSIEALIQFTQTINAERTECILHNLKPSTTYKIQVKAISYWHGYGSLESQPNTIFLSTQSIHPAFHQQSINPVQVYATPNTIQPQTEFTLQSKSSHCECGTGPQSLIVKKVFYDDQKLKALLQINMSVKIDGTTLVHWYPQVCIDSDNPSLNTIPSTILLKSKDKTVLLDNLCFNCRYGVQIRVYPTILDETHLAVKESVIQGEKQQFNSIIDYSGCFCTPPCSNIVNSEGRLPNNCLISELELPFPPTHLKVIHTGNLDYRISWRQQSAIATSDRITRNADKRPSLSSPINNKPNRNSTKYRIMWAPRIHEPVDESMYNDKIGFTPIMDLQQIDVRVIDKNQTWIALKQLKPNTFYIVRVQTLHISHDGIERESNPVSVYFTTTCDKQMKNSCSDTGRHHLENSVSQLQSVDIFMKCPLHLLISLSFLFIHFM
ncbi:Anosmin-1 [Schistosoma japonicum]|nr:Anosmin-1 [Schistosoma japonicum]